MTLVDNQFVRNTLRDPMPRAPAIGGGMAPSVLIDYSFGPSPLVQRNKLQDNDFGTIARGPVLLPADGFVDGGGNVCQPSLVLACVGGTSPRAMLPGLPMASSSR